MGAHRDLAIALAICSCPAPTASSTEHDDLLQLSQMLEERWRGDLDGIVERSLIRVLVVENRTHYFVDGAELRGLSYDALELFEDELNRKQGRSAIPVNVAYLPVQRGEIIPALLEGRGDQAVANLTITPERLAKVDFGRPWARDVREIVVTGPASPPFARTWCCGREARSPGPSARGARSFAPRWTPSSSATRSGAWSPT